MLNIEFRYRNEEERNFSEERAILDITKAYFNEIEEQDRLDNKKIKGDIFDKKIAFVIKKEMIPKYEIGNIEIEESEKIRLEPIKVKEEVIKINLPIKKFTFIERLKILFTGKNPRW